jgi:arginine N-succinyltransferase
LVVAEHLDSVNLPKDRKELAKVLERSVQSFETHCLREERELTFVLEAESSDGEKRLAGCSMIFAHHGTLKAPHVYFDVLQEERYSETLDRLFIHKILRIGYNYRGITEIGGLVLHPDFRGHPLRLGKLLSFSRFMFIAAHRAWFTDELLSELMPPLEPGGTSLLWEGLGYRFTGLTYQAADKLSRENKEFIKSLFPQGPIYASLLSPKAQSLIGEVGPATKGVEHMLRKQGFEYAERIDPFDGGPHFHAQTNDVLAVKHTQRRKLVCKMGAAPNRPGIVASAYPARAMRATYAAPKVDDSDRIALDDDVRQQLGVETGANVLFLDAKVC